MLLLAQFVVLVLVLSAAVLVLESRSAYRQ